MRDFIDRIDTKIITLLQTDGRIPNTEIARKLKLAEATVRKRIERLRANKIIRLGAWADPLKVGYQNYTSIEIQVNPPEVEAIAERLADFPEIFFLGICTGGFDILASGVFRSNEHMYEFVTKRLAQIPGIRRTSTSNVIRVVKREYAVPLPVLDEHPKRRASSGTPPDLEARTARAKDRYRSLR